MEKDSLATRAPGRLSALLPQELRGRHLLLDEAIAGAFESSESLLRLDLRLLDRAEAERRSIP